MVCKKCGRSFNDNMRTCPFCGVGQENQINIKKLENELEKLKIGDNTSSFYNENKYNKPVLDIDDIIDDLEELKVKEKEEQDVIIPRVEPISDAELLELMSDIKENKDLFITDKSQYQYIPKKIESEPEPELIDIDDNKIDITEDVKEEPKIGIRDLYNKQRLYNPEERIDKPQENIELPKVINNEYEFKKPKEKNYKVEIIVSLIIFIAVTIATILLVYKFVFSPKIKFLNNISDSYSKIQNIVDKFYSNYSQIFKHDNISVNIGATISTTINQDINKEVVNIKYIENKLDKKQYFEYTNLNSSNSEYKKMFIMNNKFYINKDNKTDEFYITDGKFISFLNNKNKENTEYLVGILIDNIKSNIKDNNIKTKTLTNKGKKLKEYTIEIDEKLYNKIYSSYLKDITDNQQALNILTDTFSYSNVELMTEIKNELTRIENKNSNKVIGTYKFYINQDKKVIKHYLSYNNYQIILLDDDKQLELTITKEGLDILCLKIKSVDEKINRYHLTLNYNNYELLGDYYEENDKVIFNLQKNNTNNELDKEIINSLLTKGTKEYNKQDNTLSIAYQKINGEEVINKKIETTNIIESDVKLPEIDITNPNKITPMVDSLRYELKENFSIFIK